MMILGCDQGQEGFQISGVGSLANEDHHAQTELLPGLFDRRALVIRLDTSRCVGG